MASPSTTPATNKYGDSGNRWWVGQNIGEGGSSQTLLGTPSLNAVNPLVNVPNGYESLPSGDAADDIQFANAAKKDKGSSNPTTISVQNISWYNIQGPYTTQSAANAAIPAIQKANPAKGTVDQATKNAGVPNPLDGLDAIGAFFGSLGESNLWIRAAKILIGGVVLTIGLAKLTGVDKDIAKAAPVVAKAALL
jgi:hypothetical protein